MEPLPIGRIVIYENQRYVITGHQKPENVIVRGDRCTPVQVSPEVLKVAYPDGVAYTIWREGVWRKFGNRHWSVYQVRRGSLTDTGENGDVRNPYVEGETDEDEEPWRLRAARELAEEFGTDISEWLV